MMRTKITPEIAAFVKANYPIKTGSEMARIVGLNPDVINGFMKKMGYKTPIEVVKASRIAWKVGKTRATPEQDSFIRDNYLLIPQKVMAERLGFSECLLRYRMEKLGLRVPRKVADRFKGGNWFRKGEVPFNKGIPQEQWITPQAMKRVEQTFFKKGNVPATKNVGSISIRYDHGNRGGKPYYYYCPEKGETIPIHKMNWEALHGPVPEGYCIWFRDGDTLNPDPSNLEMITRAENMRRNNLSDGTIAARLSQKKGKQGTHIDQDLKTEILAHHGELIEIKRRQLLLQQELKKRKDDTI